jgi:lipopolysaccharide transport system ATP-binding protein
MSEVIIKVENLSKSYLVGHQSSQPESYASLRDLIGREARNFARKVADMSMGRQIVQGDDVEEFWALKDMSFEIMRGEVVGIIGRNGAGKSTLLKILSRITEPTKGRVVLHGRVASLLEVGTGFHPELTGRENIFLNGAILGMTQSEVRRKFDAIVAFADVEKFLDTPVKRYSSGMYVRLAFAVAAHLEPDVLIVDEVLAVGDAEFQKKCLGKMDEVSRQGGRTLIFVSHNLAAVQSLCATTIWIDHGSLRGRGESPKVINEYLSQRQANRDSVLDLTGVARLEGDKGRIRLAALEWLSTLPMQHGEPTKVRLSFQAQGPLRDFSAGMGFSTLEGVRLLTFETDFADGVRPEIPRAGEHSVEIQIDALPLAPGTYAIDVGCRSGDLDPQYYDYIGSVTQVEIIPGPKTPANIVRPGAAVRLACNYKWALGA